jgi:cytoskeletal protein RodZ
MLETVGQILEQSRTERNLTLEEVATATHIRLHYLEALENNQIEKLPSGVQARGFLRNYANYLGIAVEPLLNLWEGKQPDGPQQPSEILSPDLFSKLPSQDPPSRSDFTEEQQQEDLGTEGDSENIIKDQAPQGQEKTHDALSLFIEIGDILHNQRESLGLTLKDIEHYTHVKLHYLKLLEQGQFNDLPSLVQARGMLNNYARFLEVDANHVLSIFADALQLQFSQRVSVKYGPKLSSRQMSTSAPAWKRFLTTDLLVGSSLIIILLGFAIWAATQVKAISSSEVFETAPPFSQIFSPQLLPTGGFDPLKPTKSNSSQANLEYGEGKTPVSVQNPAVTSTSAPGGLGRLNINIVSRQRTYLRITVDGKVEFEGRTISGNAYPFSANDQIELVTGNAAALQVFFNQDDLGTMGSVGQVIRLIFTTNGVITPTPGVTNTPSQTPLPTSTLQPSATQPQASVTPLIP